MHTPGRVFVDPRVNASRRHRILVVDDEPDIVESVSRALQLKFGSELDVTGAPDGMVALARLREGGIDIILTDFRMPKMNGLEFLEEAKRIAPQAVRIMMTAYPDLDLAVKAINDESVIRFLVKPLDLAKITETIRIALDGLRAREARDDLVSGAFGVGRVA